MIFVKIQGIGWVSPRRCCHPLHELSVGKKSPAVRSVSINMSTNVSKHYNKNVPAGSVFCHNHLKSERILIQTKTSTATNEELVEDSTNSSLVAFKQQCIKIKDIGYVKLIYDANNFIIR